MNVVAQVFAGVAVLVHVAAFVWETLLFRWPGVHQGIFRIPSRDVPAVLLWSFCQGFYNLALGVGTAIGLVALNAGNAAVGRALVLYTCSFMVLTGIAMLVADRLALSRPKGAGVSGVLGQISPPLVVLIASAVS